MKAKIIIFVVLILLIIVITKLDITKKSAGVNIPKSGIILNTKVPSIKMYLCIQKYSKQYNVPAGYLYAIAKHETGYDGPNDYSYDPALTSPASAVGPMQVKLSTARLFDKHITSDKLLNDIDSNVRISAMLLNKLYKIYGNWQLAFGAYNTGSPVKNKYSQNIINKNFKWVK